MRKAAYGGPKQPNHFKLKPGDALLQQNALVIHGIPSRAGQFSTVRNLTPALVSPRVSAAEAARLSPRAAGKAFKLSARAGSGATSGSTWA
jgi:hypothetical protein